jgi:hypothetical protein
MARIEWVKLRLNNWALWKARDAGGGLGFASQAAFLEIVNTTGYRESVIPIDDVDASVTNQAVESLRGPRRHLYECLQCIYPQDMGVIGAARHLGKAESTIHAQLDQADIALQLWFSERAERQEKSRKNYRAGQN